MSDRQTKQGADTAQDLEAVIRELREDGQRYRDLFDNAPMGIYRTAFDGKVLLANPAIVKMLKYDSADDLMNVSVKDATSHPDHPRQVFIDQFANTDEIYGFETQWVRKDGTTLHVRENARAVRDEKGQIVYFEGTVEDISNSKKVEKELQARLEFENLIASMSSKFANALLMEERREEVLEDTLEALAAYAGADRASVIASWSGTKSIVRESYWSNDPNFAYLPDTKEVTFVKEPWGLKRLLRNEMVYLTLSEKVHKDALQEYEMMSQMGVKSLVMAPWICSDRTVGAVVLSTVAGDKVWTQDVLNALKIAAELVGSAFERQISYDKLNDEQKLVRALMNNSPDRIYFKDSRCRFIRANKALCDRHGLAGEYEIVGKTDQDLFDGRHAAEALADDLRVMKTGIPIIAKEELETWRDGSETWASTTKVPMYDSKGDVTGLMGISRDITASKNGEKDRYRLELQMMQAQKMESLGVMCGGIAHDFNNFLMGILGNAGLALMEMAPESPAWNSVKQIETVALRAAELTNQLLAYSGKTEPERRVVHMSRLVKEMAHLLRVSIPKTTEIVYSFDDDLPGVYCDPVQIRQIVMNLMINASDAIDGETGRIEVSTGLLHCDSDMLSRTLMGDDVEDGDFVYVSVKDDGLGMDKETVDRIFDPFFTTKPTGHGLGMAVVMGVVKAHKGTIAVESSHGNGAKFTILLPAADEAERVDEDRSNEESTPTEGGVKMTQILIVEDDEIVRTVAKRILENCGFEIAEACDGDEAVKLLEEDAARFGLIMLDVTLPGTSGKAVLARAKEIKKDIPIILMSGYNEDNIKCDFGITGYDGFLKKPFDAVQMTDMVKKSCGVDSADGG